MVDWSVVNVQNILFLLQGAGVSLLLAVGSLFFGTILGIIAASMRISKNKILRAIALCYVELIRGTPMLLQIIFLNIGIPILYTAITGGIIRFNVYLIGLIAMSINSGAYSCELIRSSINAIDKGQWEAAETIGLNYSTTMFKIILPQAFKRIIPPMVSEFITLIKDSSLVSSLGAIELLYSAQIIGKETYESLLPLVGAMILYLIMTTIVSYASRILERKLAESD